MSNITFAPFPIPVVTPLGSGYIISQTNNGMHENNDFVVALDMDGQWYHFNTSQIKSYKNATYGINAGAPKILNGWTEDLSVLFADALLTEWTSKTETGKLRFRFSEVYNSFVEKHNIK